MGAYSGLKDAWKNDLIEYAKQFGYSAENILILENKDDVIKNEYPELYKKIISCVHHRDYRPPFDYARDLIASWLLEDYILYCLSECGFSVQLSGADKNRTILSSLNTSAKSDYLLKYKDNNYLIELMTDYTGYWEKTQKLDLRDNKFQKLCDDNSILFAISLKMNRFLLIDCKTTETHYIKSHKPFGGKPVYQMSLKTDQMKEFTYDNLIDEIKKYLETF